MIKKYSIDVNNLEMMIIGLLIVKIIVINSH